MRSKKNNAELKALKIKGEKSKGFTLIELLIVTIVIGLLSAIALPSFLNQAGKAKQSEAKTYIGSINRAHQADYLERGDFTTNLNDLGLGIPSETATYIYRITQGATGSSVVNRAIPSDGSFSNTLDSQATVRAYIGGVKIGFINMSNDNLGILAVLCEAINPPIITGGDSGETTEPGNLLSSSLGAPTCNPPAYRIIE